MLRSFYESIANVIFKLFEEMIIKRRNKKGKTRRKINIKITWSRKQEKQHLLLK